MKRSDVSIPPVTLNTSRQNYLDGFLAGAGAAGRSAQPGSASNAAAAVPEPQARATGGDPALPDESVAPAALSWEEEVKQALFPFDAFPRLLECAAMDQPPAEADRFRFQWFGLFYQGPEKDAFTVRLRLPGGRLKGYQLLGLAEIVQELASGALEVNAQGGADLPGVPVRLCVEALRRVEAIGLSARGAGGHCVQAVRGGEREGYLNAEPPRIYNLVRELEQVLAQNREFGNLPAGCEVAFHAADEQPPVKGKTAPADDAPRIIFRAARAAQTGLVRPAGWPDEQGADARNWQVFLPGCGDLGISLASAETVPVCLTLLRVWSRLANRASKEEASLASFCVQLGAAKLREALEQEIGKKLTLSPMSDSAAGAFTASPGIPAPDGRLLSGQMEALAQLAAQCETGEIRFVQPGCVLAPRGAAAGAFEAAIHGRHGISPDEFRSK